MKVWLEPPPGWGPKQVLLTRLRKLGYEVTEWIVLGEPLFEITG